jgi:hypothetical protein
MTAGTDARCGDGTRLNIQDSELVQFSTSRLANQAGLNVARIRPPTLTDLTLPVAPEAGRI